MPNTESFLLAIVKAKHIPLGGKSKMKSKRVASNLLLMTTTEALKNNNPDTPVPIPCKQLK
jgi:hypothetical protein